MLKEMILCEGLFHTASGVAFADFITDGHRETWPMHAARELDQECVSVRAADSSR
jgi:hypothetical protein